MRVVPTSACSACWGTLRLSGWRPGVTPASCCAAHGWSSSTAWVSGTDLALTADEQAFMEASLAERREREAGEAERQAREAKMERRSRNFLRGLVVVLAVAAVVAVVLSCL